jgi:hypothetical protein
MTTAGRILIIPKGDYNAETTYEMLDLVKHNGTSWLAKKESTGIEPIVENAEYWQNMFDAEAFVESIIEAKVEAKVREYMENNA